MKRFDANQKFEKFRPKPKKTKQKDLKRLREEARYTKMAMREAA